MRKIRFPKKNHISRVVLPKYFTGKRFTMTVGLGDEIHVPKCGKALKWSVYAERPFSTNFKVNSRSELNSGIVIQIIFYKVNQQRFEVKKTDRHKTKDMPMLRKNKQKIIWGFQMSFKFMSYSLIYKLTLQFSPYSISCFIRKYSI